MLHILYLPECYRDYLKSRTNLSASERNRYFKMLGKLLSERIRYLLTRLYPKLKGASST